MTDKFVNQYKNKLRIKETGFKVACFVGFFHLPEKKLPIQKLISMSRFANQLYKRVIKETGSKVGCFAGFCYHPVTTTSVHIKAQTNS